MSTPTITPVPFLPDLAYFEHHQKLCEGFNSSCRRHHLVKLVENAIRTGELPIDGLCAGHDRIFSHRGTGFFRFKTLGKHAEPDTIYMTAEIAVIDGEEGHERSPSLYLHIPAAFLDEKTASEGFPEFCRKRRQNRAERAFEKAREALKAAEIAQKAVDDPIEPELYYNLG